jgi:hypothetical protein
VSSCVQVGRDTISRVTSAVLEDVKAWQARPLERVYPIVYFDAMRVKVRKDRSVANRACYLALGVTAKATANRWGSGGRTQKARTSGSACSTNSNTAASRTS